MAGPQSPEWMFSIQIQTKEEEEEEEKKFIEGKFT